LRFDKILFNQENEQEFSCPVANIFIRSPSIVTLLSPKRERKKKCNSLHITKEPFFRQQQAKEIVTKSPDFLLWCEKNTRSKVFVCKSDWVFDILDVLRPLEKRKKA